MAAKGNDIQLDVEGRSAAAYLAEPGGVAPGVLVLHAWWGLNPFFKQLCDRLCEAGFIALAPDLYQGRTAGTIEEAKALLQERDTEYMGSTIQAAMRELGSLSDGTLAAMGFSMGASWALVTAANEPDLAAAVLFYGTEGVDFKEVHAHIQGHFAEADEWEPLDGVRMMEADMKTAGLDVTIHTYPGASHWFMENGRPEYNPASADLAWERTIDFLKHTLG